VRRILLVLAVALVMAAILVSSALPAFAADFPTQGAQGRAHQSACNNTGIEREHLPFGCA